ncbi:uncharacterized protein BO95DRAFT_132366 [Aspergillus brunneoviolaceus CBS 621.78]|uniref:Uncharacterized protein n=1 Tax=Aspergillus brunneoviolaceus CBS 621.78 TaxID=1450534 RepID=A0ACD1G912_9EURO|nr:hypothetical protein BO95DRAFT_132366 [Aspergillus brunneoviolaceus CBS 621.78]RAH45718.1 hypothetical protein BO95DRAFT_132366 [Aspergillus brunneoviolaceus CBS 621.78]
MDLHTGENGCAPSPHQVSETGHHDFIVMVSSTVIGLACYRMYQPALAIGACKLTPKEIYTNIDRTDTSLSLSLARARASNTLGIIVEVASMRQIVPSHPVFVRKKGQVGQADGWTGLRHVRRLTGALHLQDASPPHRTAGKLELAPMEVPRSWFMLSSR